MLHVLTYPAALVLAATLAAASVAKATHPAVTRETLGSLGGRIFVEQLVWLLVIAELTAAALITLTPNSPVALALVLALFVVFAIAGVVGMRSRNDIKCACFGAGEQTLGWRQIAQLPVATALALLVYSRADWTSRVGAALLAYALAAATAVLALRTATHWRSLRRIRLVRRDHLRAVNALEYEGTDG